MRAVWWNQGEEKSRNAPDKTGFLSAVSREGCEGSEGGKPAFLRILSVLRAT
jgi:hypothetical protein